MKVEHLGYQVTAIVEFIQLIVIGHVNGNKALTDDETSRADIDANSVIDIEDAVAMIAHVNGVKAIGS